MSDDCYVWNCENPPKHWLRIKWARTGDVAMVHYCSDHATKAQHVLTEKNLAEVTEPVNEL